MILLSKVLKYHPDTLELWNPNHGQPVMHLTIMSSGQGCPVVLRCSFLNQPLSSFYCKKYKPETDVAAPRLMVPTASNF